MASHSLQLPTSSGSSRWKWALPLFGLGIAALAFRSGLGNTFSTDFLPHGYCYLWNQKLVALHVSADLLIGLSYVAISLTLVYLVKRARSAVPFHWMLIAFGVFIIACGGTHFVEAVVLWKPVYWFAGYVKVLTAVASVATAVVLPSTIPRVLALIENAKLSQERKLQLERKNRELETILANSVPQIVWSSTPDGITNDVNERWIEYSGVAPDVSRGIPWEQVVHPADLPEIVRRWRHSLATGEKFELAYRLRRASDGAYRWHLSRALPVRDESGKILKWFGTSTDIDDQKRIEEALGASTEYLRTIIDNSPLAILSVDTGQNIRMWNRAAEKMFGWSAEEVLGCQAPVTPDNRRHEVDRVQKAWREGRSIPAIETKRKRKDGSEIDVVVSAAPISDAQGRPSGGLVMFADITERKRAEEALRGSEKLAATGRLAATIAHEINNPLESVTNLLYLLERDAALDSHSREYARLAQQELGRVVHIARQTLGFYRESAAPVSLRVTGVIEEVLDLYQRRIASSNVTVQKRFDFDGNIEAFPGELRQIFSNLIVNALDALPLAGTLKIHVYASHSRNGSSRPGIRVVIADNGTGISPDHREHIFEPFFTTKGERGTGLGLWVSQGIVHKHGGYIRLRSSERPGASGTCFSIFLPEILADAGSDAREPESPRANAEYA